MPALSAGQMRLVEETGRAILRLVEIGCKPRDIMTKDAFENVIAVTAAIGGSMNTVLHISAVAAECGLKITLNDFDRISKRTPFIVKVYPNSGQFAAADLHNAGGTKTILNELRMHLHLDATTVSGHRLGENIRGADHSQRGTGRRPRHEGNASRHGAPRENFRRCDHYRRSIFRRFRRALHRLSVAGSVCGRSNRTCTER